MSKGVYACARHDAFILHVLLIFRREDSRIVQQNEKYYANNCVTGRLKLIIQSATLWSSFWRSCKCSLFTTFVVSGLFISKSMYWNQSTWNWGILWRSPVLWENGTLPPIFQNAFQGLVLTLLTVLVRLKRRYVLETLWFRMDEVAGLTQAMSISHHQETVDENLNDSNWWKIILTGRNIYSACYQFKLTWVPTKSLSRKWSRVKKRVAKTKLAFDQSTKHLETSLIVKLTVQEHVTMEKHGDHLNIYDVISEKGYTSILRV